MMATASIVKRCMRRRVTFSRNLTLSLSRTCRCHCKYCAFATHQTHLHEPDEVEQLLKEAEKDVAAHPLASVGAALVVGLVIGLLLGRR